MTTKEALAYLCKAMDVDPVYAQGWHDNVAVCVTDEGGSRYTANKAAARFMQLAFQADTTAHAAELLGSCRGGIDDKTPSVL